MESYENQEKLCAPVMDRAEERSIPVCKDNFLNRTGWIIYIIGNSNNNSGDKRNKKCGKIEVTESWKDPVPPAERSV